MEVEFGAVGEVSEFIELSQVNYGEQDSVKFIVRNQGTHYKV